MTSLEHVSNKLCNNDYIETQYSQVVSGLNRENGRRIGHFGGFLIQNGKSTKMECVLNGGLIKVGWNSVLAYLTSCKQARYAVVSLAGPLLAVVGVTITRPG